MTETTEILAAWAVLDLFGRQRAAGFLTEVKRAGQDFLRLHIPATNGQQARTIDYHPNAVYGIEYVDEETARMAATLDHPPLPVETWSARRLIEAGGSQLALDVPDAEIVDDDPQQLDLDDEEDPF
jgi:hypothetical protein